MNENALVEANGICGSGTVPIDRNGDEDTDDTVPLNVNGNGVDLPECPGTPEVLNGFNDFDRIDLNFRDNPLNLFNPGPEGIPPGASLSRLAVSIMNRDPRSRDDEMWTTRGGGGASSRPLLAGARRVALAILIGTCPADPACADGIPYEVLEGSGLSQSDRFTDLRGSFTLELTFVNDWNAGGAIRDMCLSFAADDDPGCDITGRGSVWIRAWEFPEGVLLVESLSFLLDIEGELVRFESPELGSAHEFPLIRGGGFQTDPEDPTGSFILAARPTPEGARLFFRRGDSNADDRIDISDPVHTLEYVFGTGDPPACLDAADADDGGSIEVSDAVLELVTLFLGTGRIAPPSLYCGVDLTGDSLGCAGETPCFTRGRQVPDQ